MMAEQVIGTMLLAAAPVTALVGAGDAARIYPSDKAPQGGPLPYITYQRISGRTVVGLTLEGAYGLDAIRVQVNAWDAMNGGNASALAQKIRQVLHGATADGPAVVQCSAPADFPSDEKLQIEGARVDAIVTMNEAAEAA
jgi:hypothetical protein